MISQFWSWPNSLRIWTYSDPEDYVFENRDPLLLASPLATPLVQNQSENQTFPSCLFARCCSYVPISSHMFHGWLPTGLRFAVSNPGQLHHWFQSNLAHSKPGHSCSQAVFGGASIPPESSGHWGKNIRSKWSKLGKGNPGLSSLLSISELLPSFMLAPLVSLLGHFFGTSRDRKDGSQSKTYWKMTSKWLCNVKSEPWNTSGSNGTENQPAHRFWPLWASHP